MRVNHYGLVLYLQKSWRECGSSLHSAVTQDLWSLIFCLFGSSMLELLSHRMGHNGEIWNIVPLCLMWGIWRERNANRFEWKEMNTSKLKFLFLKTLYD